MHFEILVEDASGKKFLEAVLGRILDPRLHTHRIIAYKGVGRIQKGLEKSADPSKRILLENLPRLLQGYGKSLPEAAVVVVVDVDNKDCRAFKRELVELLEECDPKPRALFRLAIEEMEAWLLGDRSAIEAAYPKTKGPALDAYHQDSICGTWEVLADAVYPKGAAALKALGYPQIGIVKSEWAEKIGSRLDVEGNRSKSFQVFRDGIRQLAEGEQT